VVSPLDEVVASGWSANNGRLGKTVHGEKNQSDGA
jgi:hypothetical protein